MKYVVLSLIDSDVEAPLVGVCSYPQYDTPLKDVKHALSDYLTAVMRVSNNSAPVVTEASGELWYTITVSSNDIPPDGANTRRVINRLMNMAHDFFYKENPDAGTSRQ